MNKILVDSPIWIDYLNKNNSKANILSDLIDNNSICINNLILAELVPFIKKAGESELVDLLMSVYNIELVIDWNEIIKMQTTNLKNGINKVGIPDLIILENVIKNELTLLTFDNHFKLMKKFHEFKMLEI